VVNSPVDNSPMVNSPVVNSNDRVADTAAPRGFDD